MQYLQIQPDGEITEKAETGTKRTKWGMETNGIRRCEVAQGDPDITGAWGKV